MVAGGTPSAPRRVAYDHNTVLEGIYAPIGRSQVRGFFNYFNFTGRTRRVDYWWYRLAYLIILFGPTVIVALIFGDSDIFGDSETNTTTLLGTVLTIFYGIVLLWFAIPELSITVRRLHDAGQSGKWVLAAYVSMFAGFLIGGLAALRLLSPWWLAPVVVSFILIELLMLIFTLLPSRPSGERYGPHVRYGRAVSPKVSGTAETAS